MSGGLYRLCVRGVPQSELEKYTLFGDFYCAKTPAWTDTGASLSLWKTSRNKQKRNIKKGAASRRSPFCTLQRSGLQ
jgi:hypothetical protein